MTAIDYSTGLAHASGFQDVDLISIAHPCRLVRLYYLFGFQGASGTVPPVTAPIRSVVDIAREFGRPLRTKAWLLRNIRRLRRHDTYTLPYPDSYWFI